MISIGSLNMTRNVFQDPSQLNPVSFWPDTVFVSEWIIWIITDETTSTFENRIYLYIDTIVSWAMYATVETKANNKNSTTYSKSYSVASARISPSIIKINNISSRYQYVPWSVFGESRNYFFFSSMTTSRLIGKSKFRLKNW